MADSIYCSHTDFAAQVNVIRLKDSGRFVAEIHIKCLGCGTPFQFLGLKPGMDLDGATVSVDGLEANIAICPEGQQPSPLDNFVRGYKILKDSRLTDKECAMATSESAHVRSDDMLKIARAIETAVLRKNGIEVSK